MPFLLLIYHLSVNLQAPAEPENRGKHFFPYITHKKINYLKKNIFTYIYQDLKIKINFENRQEYWKIGSR